VAKAVKRKLALLFAGGGTAGHVLPAMATTEALINQSRDESIFDVEITYLATKNGAERKILEQAGAKFRIVPKTDLPRKISTDLVTFPIRLVRALLLTLPLVRRVDVVVGFGGYVALPAYLAAYIAKKPLIIHEANALPGLANRLGRRFADRALANFPIPGWSPSDVIGLPIRESIWRIGGLNEAERITLQERARTSFGLDLQRKTILVFGGSLGAARINQALGGALDQLLSHGYQILHSTGAGKNLLDARPGYHPVQYISEMDQAYLAADLVISRSGAGTCAEIEATGIPAIMVPLAIGNGEQLLNAEQVARNRADAGSAVVLQEDNLSAASLLHSIEKLITLPYASSSSEDSPSTRMAQIIIEAGGSR